MCNTIIEDEIASCFLTSEGQTGEEADVATSTSESSDENDDNSGSDDDKAIVCLPPLTKSRGGVGGGGILPPLVLITLVGPLDTSNLERGRRDGGSGKKELGQKHHSPR